MAEVIDQKRLKVIRNLVYNECSNFHFNNGCYNVACDVKQFPHPSKQCCFICEVTGCKSFRKCRFFDEVIHPMEVRRAAKVEKEKLAKLKYKEAIRKQQGIVEEPKVEPKEWLEPKPK